MDDAIRDELAKIQRLVGPVEKEVICINDFPEFMKNPQNAITSKSQSKGIEGYVYDGTDGSQMAHWKCNHYGVSDEHCMNLMSILS